LSAKVPNYNLQRAHDENPIFHDVPTLSLWDGLRAVRSSSGTKMADGLSPSRRRALGYQLSGSPPASGR
jgi:hypothetical protein